MNKEEVIDLIRDAGFGFLATTDGNQPHVRPMMPYLTDNGSLLVALLASSRTIPQVKENPKVELCFVDRKMWLCRITGTGSIVQDMDKKETAWNNIPMLRQYFSSPQDPKFILLEIHATLTEAMTPHQKEPTSIDLKS